MPTTRPYRPGALAALVDEYHRAAEEFGGVVEALSEEEFAYELYPADPTRAFRSIRTILRHVVASGYLYADYLRRHLGTPPVAPERHLTTRADALSRMREMLRYSEDTLQGRWEMAGEEIESPQIVSDWKVVYSVEQLLEHAIVHLLRHRRQVERYRDEIRSARAEPAA